MALAGLLFLSCVVLAVPARAVQSQVLHGQIPAAVAGLQPVGRVPATKPLRLAIALPLRNQEALNLLLQQLYDPASPKYRQWLIPEQFTDQFGPTEADYQALMAFAKANGLAVTATHPNRVILDVEGAASDIENAFHVTLRIYPHPSEARTFYAPDTEPSLALAVPLSGISGLDDFSLPHPNSRPRPATKAASTTPASGSGNNGTYRGNDFRAAYVPGTALTGAGQTVGLLQFDGYYASDILAYETEAGLTNVPLTNVPIDGGVATPGGNNAEVCLDIEMVISMAPGVSRIYVYEAPNPSPWVDLLNRMANDNVSKQLSCSWGGGSHSGAEEAIFQQMAAQGQSFFNASGDSDAFCSGTGISFPSESPNITQVGGTTLATTGPGGAYVSETVWNWGGGIGSSGGVSVTYPIPAWQQGISMSANFGSTSMRNMPDVALTADNVYVRYNNGLWGSFGGTSCAAPLWAGFTALVNQQAAANGRPTVGFINPAIYALGKGTGYASTFHDTTVGSSTNNCRPTLFPAVAGYDLSTGWGSPAGSALIDALAGPADALQVTPAAGFYATGGPGGPFDVIAQTFSLTNVGSASLSWTLSTTSLWLSASAGSGSLTPGGPAASLTFSLNTVASSLPPGTYSTAVWFTNLSDGVCQGRWFTLKVLGAPVILAQPTDLTVRFGEAATFSVNATGAPPVSYFWRRDGAFMAGATQASYSADNVQVTASGSRFSCLVSNAYGTMLTSNATLTVSPSLIVNGGFETGDFTGWDGTKAGAYVTTSSYYVHAGAYGVELGPVGAPGYLSQTLPTVIGSNYLVSLWLNNPNGGTPNEFQVMWNGTSLYDGLNLPVLAWTNLQFVVAATSASSTLQLGFRNDPSWLGLDDISVVPASVGPSPPVISTQPLSQAVPVGSTVAFSVGATGTAPLSYFWKRNGALIAGATASSYITNNVQLADSGSRFSCLVSNTLGTAVSSNATLWVAPAVFDLITFDDLPFTAIGTAVPAEYHGLTWNNFNELNGLAYSTPSGYQSGVVSASNVVYNPYGNPASITSVNPFNFISAYLTAAWTPNLVVRVSGYVGDVLAYDNTYALSTNGPAFITFNYNGVTEVHFSTSNNTQLVMDDVRVGTVSAGAVDHFEWSIVASPQTVNRPFGVSITAKDDANATVTNFSATVALSASGGSVADANTILDGLTPSGSYAGGSYTDGYAFTPNVDLLVTHVRHFYGSKVSLWTDGGVLLASQTVTSTPGVWVETPLATPLTLSAGTRYRIGIYYPAGTTFYWNASRPATFANGTIDAGYYSVGDAFPTTDWGAYTSLVDVRYTIGGAVSVEISPGVSGSFVSGVWTGSVAVLHAAINVVLRADDGSGHSGSSNPFAAVNAAPAQIIVGVPADGDASESSALCSTLTNLGFAVQMTTNAQWAGANVVVTYPGCDPDSFGPSLSEISNGVSVVQIGDWGSDWTPNSWKELADGTNITVSLDAAHPITAGLPSSWGSHGFWRYGYSAYDYYAWSTDAALTSLASISAPDSQSRLLVASSLGSGRAVFMGWNVYGPDATANDMIVLRNAILWAAAATTNAPPAILAQPQNVITSPGSAASFCVTAVGTPPLSYSWRRNGVLIAGATASCYTTNNVQLADSGSVFSCLVSNAYGTAVSSNATLTVLSGGLDVITFDDLPGTSPLVPAGYHGFTWSNIGYLNAYTITNSGYYAGMITVSNVAADPGGATGSMSRATPFNLVSAHLTAAWNDDLQLQALGYGGGTLVYHTTNVLSATNPALVSFNFYGVTNVVFIPSGGTHHTGYTGSGTHFVMDNVAVSTGAAPLRFAVGNNAGPPLTQLVVPVQATRFTNISSFQFSLHWDPAIASFAGVEQFGVPGLADGNFGTGLTNNGTLTVSWDDPAGLSKTVADGTTVFAARFQTVGAPNTVTALTIDGTPTPIEAADGNLALVPVETVPGQLSVSPTATVSGVVTEYAAGLPVPGVTLAITGSTNLSLQTPTNGAYSVALNLGGTYLITAGKTDDSLLADGVTTLDISLIRRHILNGLPDPLDSPYALLAADVNGSQSVTTLDITLIRRLILGLTNSFPAGVWRFLPANYACPDPLNPWNAPGCLAYTNLLANLPNQNYIAVKLGDVNHSWTSGGMLDAIGVARSAPQVSLQIGSYFALPGEAVTARVVGGGLAQLTSAQLTLEWDPAVLQYRGTGDYGLDEMSTGNFGACLAAGGKLAVSWDDPAANGITLPDGTVLFSVTFAVIGQAGNVSRLALADSIAPREIGVALTPAALRTQDGQVSVVAGGPPQLGVATYSQGVFSVSLPTLTGKHYVLEFRDSLTGGQWTPFSAILGDGTLRTLTDSSASSAHRFYRVRVE